MGTSFGNMDSTDQLGHGAIGEWHAITTAPLFSGDAIANLSRESIPQKALYGRIISQNISSENTKYPENPKLYMNINTPFSALICGVQGSGKSHSTSIILEGCLLRSKRLGTLPAPLSALVFHFDTAAGGGVTQPCEAAFLATLESIHGVSTTTQAPPVKVLVVPGSLRSMRRLYSRIPGVQVEALRLAPNDINANRLLLFMKADAASNSLPLYMEYVLSILRSTDDEFDYASFRQRLDDESSTFNSSQKAMLKLRLSLLESFIQGGTEDNKASNYFVQGQLTVIDLSSPFMDNNSACALFDIILGLFIEKDVGSGKVVVLDEAHKYLSMSSSQFTDSLLTVIRQQRHLGMRVVVSTQEPDVVPAKFIDLCSFIIAHRFSSPTWLDVLSKHISAGNEKINELFAKIVTLRTGECIIFSPSGLVKDVPHNAVLPLGTGYLIAQSRLRITHDGGQSVLATETTPRQHFSSQEFRANGSAECSDSAGKLNRIEGGYVNKQESSWAELREHGGGGQAAGVIDVLVEYLVTEKTAGQSRITVAMARRELLRRGILQKHINSIFERAVHLGRITFGKDSNNTIIIATK